MRVCSEEAILIATILILIVLLGVWFFLSSGRAGGEIGFGATVTIVEDNLVYATVTEDHAGFGTKKLPETIVICAEEFPEFEFHVGDQIDGCYIRKTHEGNFYRVVSILVNGQ